MTPNCKWASSTSAGSPPLFWRRSLSLFKTPTAQTVPSSDLLPPWLTLPSPRCRLPSAPSPHAGGEPGPQPGPVSAPGRGQALHACSSCLLTPPPLPYNLHWKKHTENKNSLSTLILESSRSSSVPRGCKACALLGVLNFLLLLSGKVLPLPPAWGASLPFRSHRRYHLLREVLCYRVLCHLR